VADWSPALQMKRVECGVGGGVMVGGQPKLGMGLEGMSCSSGAGAGLTGDPLDRFRKRV
jgi:hypothetical protein